MSKLNIALIDENMGFIPETKIEKRGNKYEGYSFEELKVIIDEKKAEYKKELDVPKESFLNKENIEKRQRLQQELLELAKALLNS